MGVKTGGKHAPYEPKSDEMMCDKFLVILARLLKTKDEDNELLAPVRRLHEIVALQSRCHLPVWVIYNQ
jgi:hypothetical protein